MTLPKPKPRPNMTNPRLIPDEPQARRVIAYLMPERELQNNVIEMAERLGLLVYHTHDSRRSQPGFPDLVIAGKRGIVYAELKRQRGKLTDEQQAWRQAIEATAGRSWTGHEYHLWRPHDWLSGDVEDVLRRIA